MSNWIVYYESDGRIAFHDYIGNEAKVQKLCNANPGLTYIAGKCHPEGCKVDISQDPPVILHNQNKPPVIALVRQRRNIMLTACDWTVGADSPLSDSKKAEWQTYRQALRDVPVNQPDVTDLFDVVWPTPPA
tara:strand:- start:1632 stop:2027 length:396 start_codon:yes stop_codon:yes gene_type:complete